MAAAYEIHRPCGIALALCLFLLFAIQSSAQHGFPTEHGLTYEKNPGEVSPGMTAFFSQPKVELPMAQSIPQPASRAAARTEPMQADTNQTGGRKKTTLLVTGIVFAVLAAGLLVTAAVVGYMLHAHRSHSWSSSSSAVGLAFWKNEREAQLGAA